MRTVYVLASLLVLHSVGCSKSTSKSASRSIGSEAPSEAPSAVAPAAQAGVPNRDANIEKSSGEESEESVDDPLAEHTLAMKDDLAQKLAQAGVPDADIARILQRMDEEAAGGLELTAGGAPIARLVARLASAAVRVLGSLDAMTADASMRQGAVVAMTSTFAGYAARNVDAGADAASSLQGVAAAVSSGLADAGISAAELDSVLAASANALVVAVNGAATARGENFEALVASATSGFAQGVADVYPAEAVVAAVGGLGRGIVEGALASGLSAASVGSLAGAALGKLTSDLSSKGFVSDTIATNVLTGIVTAAKAGDLISEQIAAIVDKAAAAAPTVDIVAIVDAVDADIAEKAALADKSRPGLFALSVRATRSLAGTKAASIELLLTPVEAQGFSNDDGWEGEGTNWIAEDSPPPSPRIEADVVSRATHLRWRLDKAGSKDDDVTSVDATGDYDEDVETTRSARGEPAAAWSEWRSVSSSLSIDISSLTEDSYSLFVEARAGGESLGEQELAWFRVDHTAPAPTLVSEGDDPDSNGRFGVYLDEADRQDVWGFKYWVGAAGSSCQAVSFRNYWFTDDKSIRTVQNPPAAADLGTEEGGGWWWWRDDLPVTAVYRVCVMVRDAAGNVGGPFAIDATSAIRRKFEAVEVEASTFELVQAPQVTAALRDEPRSIASPSGEHLVWISEDGQSFNITSGGVTSQIFDAGSESGSRRILEAKAAESGRLVVLFWSDGLRLAHSTNGVSWSVSLVSETSSIASGRLTIAGDIAYVVFSEYESGADEYLVKLATRDLAAGASWNTEMVTSFEQGWDPASYVAVGGGKKHVVSVVDGFALYRSADLASTTWSDEILVGGPLYRELDGELHESEEFWIHGDISFFYFDDQVYFVASNLLLRKDPADDIWAKFSLMTAEQLQASMEVSEESEESEDNDYWGVESWQAGDIHRMEPAGGSIYAMMERGWPRTLTVARSSDGSTTWVFHPVATDKGDSAQLSTSGNRVSLVYRDVHQRWRSAASTDAGVSWNTTTSTVTVAGEPLGYDSPGAGVIHAGHVFDVNGSRIRRKLLGAATWQEAERLGNADSFALASGNGYLYAASCRWVARSSDLGLSWEAVALPAPVAESTSSSCRPYIGVSGTTVTLAYEEVEWSEGSQVSRTILAQSNDGGATYAASVLADLGANRPSLIAMDGATPWTAWSDEESGMRFARLNPTSGAIVQERVLPAQSASRFLVRDGMIHALVGNNYVKHDGSDWSTELQVCGDQELDIRQLALRDGGILVLGMRDSDVSLHLCRQTGPTSFATTLVDGVDAARWSDVGLLADGSLVHVFYESMHLGYSKHIVSQDGGATFPAD